MTIRAINHRSHSKGAHPTGTAYSELNRKASRPARECPFIWARCTLTGLVCHMGRQLGLCSQWARAASNWTDGRGFVMETLAWQEGGASTGRWDPDSSYGYQRGTFPTPVEFRQWAGSLGSRSHWQSVGSFSFLRCYICAHVLTRRIVPPRWKVRNLLTSCFNGSILAASDSNGSSAVRAYLHFVAAKTGT